MATFFTGERNGKKVIGMALPAEDLDALLEGASIYVDISPTAQSVLGTDATQLVLLPCETEAEVIDAGKRMRAVIHRETRPH